MTLAKILAVAAAIAFIAIVWGEAKYQPPGGLPPPPTPEP